MKKTIIALAAIAFSGAVLAGGPDPMAAPAAPQDNLYFGFHVDMTSSFYERNDQNPNNANSFTWLKTSTPMAFNQAGFQTGMLFGAFRAEISISYNNTLDPDFNVGDPVLLVFLKGAYDLQLGHGLSVYPVAGIGFDYQFKEGSDTSSSTDFAYLLGAGTTLALNNKTSISGEYNWVSSSAAEETAPSPIDSAYNISYKNFGANVFSIRWNRTF